MDVAQFNCVCGKSFNSVKSLSAHKASCRTYYLHRDGNLDIFIQRNHNIKCAAAANHDKRSASISKVWHNKQINKLNTWLSTNPKCERCNQPLTKYYGSGRFCSKFCANAKHHTLETKQKIGISNHRNALYMRNVELYLANPKYCVICGAVISYDNRHRNTCSKVCKNKLCSINAKNRGLGGYIQFSGNNRKNKGTYMGYYCDSTWELAYVIYCLEHNVQVKRCHRKYSYTYNGKCHTYHPDFELVDGTLVEIKGYEYDDTDITSYKVAAVDDRSIIVLREPDIKPIYNYVVKKYGKDFRYLYDSNYV